MKKTPTIMKAAVQESSLLEAIIIMGGLAIVFAIASSPGKSGSLPDPAAVTTDHHSQPGIYAFLPSPAKKPSHPVL